MGFYKKYRSYGVNPKVFFLSGNNYFFFRRLHVTLSSSKVHNVIRTVLSLIIFHYFSLLMNELLLPPPDILSKTFSEENRLRELQNYFFPTPKGISFFFCVFSAYLKEK